MSIAIFTAIHAVTRADAEIAACAQEVARAARFYASQLAQRRAECPHISDADVAQFEARGTCTGGLTHSLQQDFLTHKKALRALDRARRLDWVDIAVVKSYAIKDALRQAGYRYRSDGYWHDFAGLRVSPAWCKTVLPEEALAEIERLRALGCELRLDHDLNHLVANIKADLEQ
jgi:hypothetical protein